jgi:hypothetical protein
MGRVVQCGIYEERPPMCESYPEPGHYRPPECTFYFDEAGTRHGECAEECMSTCCHIPREGGEPGGAGLPAVAGGLPCKHLVVDEGATMDGEKTAAATSEMFEEGIRAIFGD